jgi:hypothetical protein
MFDDAPDAIVIPFFQNCVLPNEGAENDNPDDVNAQVVHCLIKGQLYNGKKLESPQFKVTASDDLHYDFRLDSVSSARNVADPAIARKLPKDIKGVDRFMDEGPDIGGYEYHP